MKNIKEILLLQLSVFIYSLGAIFSKNASNEPFLSKSYIFNVIILIMLLAVHSIMWQQILKHTSLSFAYINRAMSIIWGLIIGFILFHENFSFSNIFGIIIVIVGIMIVSFGEKENG